MGVRIEVQIKFANSGDPTSRLHIEQEAFCSTVAGMAIRRLAEEFCSAGHTVEELDSQTLPAGVSRWVVNVPVLPAVKIGPTDI